MRAFFGGQIKEECRGDLAVVVARDETLEKYDAFMYPTKSEEFVVLTGVRAARYLPDRVYIGLSHDAGKSVIKGVVDKNPDKVDLEGIDRLVVIPHFLGANQEKPNRIVLEAIPGGYEVVEAK